MASINNYLTQISNAVYGEDVRGSIHDAIQAINDENVNVLNTAREYRNSAQTASQAAVEAKEEATQAAESIGNEITEIKSDLENLFSNTAKRALLDCIANIALWSDDEGEEHYATLEAALFPSLYPKITAAFDAGSTVFHAGADLNTLKPYLTVKYYESQGDEGATVTTYTLSGQLTKGTSIITVTYNGLVAQFTVTGVVEDVQLQTVALKGIGAVFASSDTVRIQDNNSRLTLASASGTHPWIDNSTGQDSNYYPVPIPEGATTLYVKGVPSGYDWSVQIVKYVDGRGWARNDSPTATWGGTSLNKDISQFNDGQYYMHLAFATAGGHTGDMRNVDTTSWQAWLF